MAAKILNVFIGFLLGAFVCVGAAVAEVEPSLDMIAENTLEQTGEMIEQNLEEAEEEELQGWEKYPPIVESAWYDPETTRITAAMPEDLEGDELLAVKAVRLETVIGETLGVKSYYPHEKTRSAEFNVNHKTIEDDWLIVKVVHLQFGTYETTVKLWKVRHDPEVLKAKEAAEAAERAAETERIMREAREAAEAEMTEEEKAMREAEKEILKAEAAMRGEIPEKQPGKEAAKEAQPKQEKKGWFW